MSDTSSRPHISSATPGPALAILCLCSAATSSLVAGTVVLYQARLKHIKQASTLDLNWNILLGFGLVLSIAQSAITFKQVSYGLGYPISQESAHGLRKFEQYEYANDLLYVGALLVLKAVQVQLQFAVTYPKPNYYVPAVIMVGMVGFLLAAAFQCHAPDFGAVRSGQCFDRTAFWTAFGIYDVISDLYSTAAVLNATKSLQMQSKAKAKLFIVLMSKLLPTGCAISRLPFIHPAYSTHNYTIALYKLAMPTQLQLHLAIVALSMGKIFRFLKVLNTGYLNSAIDPPSKSNTGYRYYTLSRYRNGHVKKPSISDSSKELTQGNELLPTNYGHSRAYAEAIPIDEQPTKPQNTLQQNGGERMHVNVRTDVEIAHETERPSVYE